LILQADQLTEEQIAGKMQWMTAWKRC